MDPAKQLLAIQMDRLDAAFTRTVGYHGGRFKIPDDVDESGYLAGNAGQCPGSQNRSN